MKRILLSFIFSFVATVFATAQEDSVRFKITYDTYFRFRQSEPKGKTDKTVLAIGEHSSRFYSPKLDRRMEIKDSVLALGGDAYAVIGAYEKEKVNRLGITYNIFKNYPKRGRLVFNKPINPYQRYEEEMIRPEWELLDKDTVVCGYNCQMAMTCFLGRQWTVAYTTDIPLSEGPWKLWGLPGLILYACDSLGDFSFCAIGIENGDRKTIREHNVKYIKSTPEDVEALEIMHLQDPDTYSERTIGKRPLKHFDANGREFKPKPDMPVLIEYRKNKK